MSVEKINEIFDIQAINKQVSEVIKKIESVASVMETTVSKITACNSQIAVSSNYDELTKAVGKFTKVNDEYVYQTKEMAQLQRTQIQLEQKLQQAYLETAKQVERVRQEVAEETKAIKDSVKAQREQEKAQQASSVSITEVIAQLKRQRDSVAELTAENKRLRDVAKSMDYNTQKAEIDQINTVINANTALIELNSDAYVKQKMNIGNYKTAVEGLDSIIKSLGAEMKRIAEAGGENSEEFKKLTAEFQHAQSQSAEFTAKIVELADGSIGLKKELREIKEQMQELAMAGEEDTAAYEQLTERAVELTQAINGVNDQIRNMEAPTAVFDSIMSGLNGLAGGFEVYQGAMGLIGLESEEFERIQATVQSAIAITNGLTAISAALDKDSAFMIGLKNAAQSKNVIVSKAATVAQWAFNAAMNANPIFLLITGLIAGLAALGAWAASTKEASAEQKRLNEVQKNAIDNYAKEKTEIETLSGKIKDGNATREDQSKMIAILNEKYGENFTKGKSMQEMEKAFIDNADAFVEAAIKRAEAQAAFELAIESQKKALEAGTKGAEEYVGWWGRLFRTEETEAKLAEERRAKEIADLEKQSQNYLKIQAEKQQAEQEAKAKSGELSDAEKKAEAEKTKNLETQTKKRVELRQRDQKATSDIETLKIQQQANVLKMIYDDETSSYDVRLSALINYENKEIELIEKRKNEQLADAKKTAKEKELIEQKAADDIRQIKEKNEADFTKLEQQAANKQIAALIIASDAKLSKVQNDADKEYAAAAKQYAKGELKEEEYQQKKLAIQRKYEDQMFVETIAAMQKRIGVMNIEPAEKERLAKELNQKLIDYNKWKNDAEIADDESAGQKKGEGQEQEKEKQKQLKDLQVQLAQEAFDAIGSITSSMFDRKIQQVDAEIEKLDEQKEHDLAVVEEMNISDEEKAARKEAIEVKAEAQKEKLEKKKQKLQLQQAKTDKANAMIQVAMNTALAVMRIWADVPKIDFGISTGVLTGAAIAMGAMQLAAIAAQPLPQYAEGTSDHPGGLAIVGDGGKKELVKTQNGNYFVTPDTPTLIDLPKHTQVLPDFNLALQNLSFTPVVGDDMPSQTERLEKRLEALEKAIKETTAAVVQNRPQMNINIDKNGLWETYERQKGRTKYINERLNINR